MTTRLTSPPAAFTIITDTREQRPFSFLHLRPECETPRRPVTLSFLRATLPTGDYSVAGLEAHVAIERKSASDLYGTIGSGRARFTRELERLNTIPVARVIVESELSDLLHSPPGYSRLTFKQVLRSVDAWTIRYPRVHWCFCPGRALAERRAFRILERVWRLSLTPERNGAA